MPAHDDCTSGRGYPLPHPDNLLNDPDNPAEGDVMRLRAALEKADADVVTLNFKLDEAADAILLGLDVV